MTSRSFHGARRTRFAGALTTGAGAIRDANDWMSVIQAAIGRKQSLIRSAN
jgi:hypothetical protein